MLFSFYFYESITAQCFCNIIFLLGEPAYEDGPEPEPDSDQSSSPEDEEPAHGQPHHGGPPDHISRVSILKKIGH